MPVKITCRNCDSKLKGPDKYAGQCIKCPRCGEPVPVPALTATPEPRKDFADPEPGRRPRRDRSNRPLVYVLAGSGALLVLLLVGLVVVLASRSSPASNTHRAELPRVRVVEEPQPDPTPAPPQPVTPAPVPTDPVKPASTPEPPVIKKEPTLPTPAPSDGERLFMSRIAPGDAQQPVTPTPAPGKPTAPSAAQWVTIVPPKPLGPTVKKGVEWLLRTQKPSGGWATEESGRLGMPGATDTKDQAAVTDTCLATLALLRAADMKADPESARAILRAIDFVCQQVEKSAADSPFVTDQRRTVAQMKMGEHFDTYLAAWLLAEAAGRMPDSTTEERVQKALAKTVAKVQKQQRADGGWFDASLYDETTGRPSAGMGRPPMPPRPPIGGPGAGPPPGFAMPALAPVLGQAVAAKGLNRAIQAGAEVDATVLSRARDFALRHFRPTRRDFALQGSFGIVLYASASHLGAMQDAINTGRMVAGGTVNAALQKEMSVRDDAFQAVVGKLNDAKFLMQFGNYGGEDFLAYMLLSEAMAIKSDATWAKWDRSMSEQLTKQQNQDGSWTGHHCTTGRTFCTAAVVLTLAADRAPVPVSSLQQR